MEVSARAATLADLDILSELATQAVQELTPNRGGDVWRRHQARSLPPAASLADDLAAADRSIAVGMIDDVVVGYGVIRTEELRDETTLAVISELYTLPDARAVGVGEAVMDDLLAWARERGCFGVDSIALPGDRHTKNFFESFGLVARAIVVHRRLDP